MSVISVPYILTIQKLIKKLWTTGSLLDKKHVVVKVLRGVLGAKLEHLLLLLQWHQVGGVRTILLRASQYSAAISLLLLSFSAAHCVR